MEQAINHIEEALLTEHALHREEILLRGDARIAAWLAPHIELSRVTQMRRESPAYWDHLLDEANSRPAFGNDAAAWDYLVRSLDGQEYHGPDYVRPSERDYAERNPDRPNSLMDRVFPPWLIVSVLCTVAVWFFARPSVLAAFNYASDFGKGLFQ